MGKLSCLTMRTDMFFNGRMYHHCTLYSSGIIRDNTTREPIMKSSCTRKYVVHRILSNPIGNTFVRVIVHKSEQHSTVDSAYW